jgi:hypothetical protein
VLRSPPQTPVAQVAHSSTPPTASL